MFVLKHQDKFSMNISFFMLQSISGKHAVIEVEDEESHVIYDCGSTNKTKLGQVQYLSILVLT